MKFNESAGCGCGCGCGGSKMNEGETLNEEKYTVIDPRGNNVGAGLKIQAAAMAKKKGGEKA